MLLEDSLRTSFLMMQQYHQNICNMPKHIYIYAQDGVFISVTNMLSLLYVYYIYIF